MMNRRQLLKLLSAGGFSGLSGCSSFSQRETNTISPESSPSPGATSSSSPTESPSETEFAATDTASKVNPVEHDKLIGAHYYPWYNDKYWSDFPTPGNPTLGNYDSANPKVAEQHIKWAVEHGINWFNVSWFGPNTKTDRNLRDTLSQSDLFHKIKFSILYESLGRFSTDSNGDLNFDIRENRETLRNDFLYLQDQYMERSNYLKIDGQPVIFCWAANSYAGSVRDAFKEALGALNTEIYLIGAVLGAGPNILQKDWMGLFDCATIYNIYNGEIVEGNNYERFLEYAESISYQWYIQTGHSGHNFIPNVIPGYNDSLFRDNPVLERSPQDFTSLCQKMAERADPELNAILITSFNEWPEYTAVEPSERYGKSYLEIIKRELADTDFKQPEIGDFDQLELDFNKTVRPSDLNSDSTDTRRISLMLGRLILFDEEGNQIRNYNVGLPSKEPVFIEGAHGIEKNPESSPMTWRWLGGVAGKCGVFIEPSDAEFASAQFIGRPAQNNEIEADVIFNHQVTDHFELGGWNSDPNEYTVSLKH